MSSRKEEKRVENRLKACMIDDGSGKICIDPALPIIELLGKKYTLMVIGVLGNKGGRKNFNEVLSDIPFSSSTIISRRLKDLRNAGIIVRKIDSKGITYSLTEFGLGLRKAMLPLLRLLEGNQPEPRQPRSV
ncbi:MAG: winged helix-turn-helix transcriptional regulator [Thermoplasmata archaeon]